MKEKNKRKIGFRSRMTYIFDSIMSKGTVSRVAILFLITALVVIISGIIAALFTKDNVSSVGNGIWISLMHAIDAGTITADNGSFLYMFLMTGVTICGLFITSVLIGIINTGMEKKMESLSKGKSCIIEQNHVIILGITRNIYTIVNELIEANSISDKGVIVIMDDNMEIDEMENALHQRIPNTKNTKIIFRNGSITDISDLKICSPQYAKSIIINSENDFITIKSILAVNSLIKDSEKKDTFITAVIKDRENYEAAIIAGGDKAEILFFEDTIARIVAHASRQTGLSKVYSELFTFNGNEIYIENIPGLEGKKFKELNRYFPVSTVIGIKRNNKTYLLPDNEERIKKNDNIVLIANCKGISKPLPEPVNIKNNLIINNKNNSPAKRRRMLFFGYSPNLSLVLNEEDAHLAPGSEILLAVQEEYSELIKDQMNTSYKNIKVNLFVGDIYHKTTVTKLLEWTPDSILVLSSQETDAQMDDSKTLLLLLQLRAISKEKHVTYNVTSEMRESENQELAQITEVKYFVISSNITSHMITQISQEKELNSIFSELLTKDGSEIYMRPASDYVKTDTPVDLYTACSAATVKNQVLIGYRKADDHTGEFEVFTNPPKNTEVSFTDKDRFIVLSKN